MTTRVDKDYINVWYQDTIFNLGKHRAVHMV
jgi:hypothetical protein